MQPKAAWKSDVFNNNHVGGVESRSGSKEIRVFAFGKITGEILTVSSAPPRFDTYKGGVFSDRGPEPHKRRIEEQRLR